MLWAKDVDVRIFKIAPGPSPILGSQFRCKRNLSAANGDMRGGAVGGPVENGDGGGPLPLHGAQIWGVLVIWAAVWEGFVAVSVGRALGRREDLNWTHREPAPAPLFSWMPGGEIRPAFRVEKSEKIIGDPSERRAQPTEKK